eukprot:TRINITY_DN1994_c0_g1_i1.p1 TRINITY_DN1994_c0_g1~~TRINITY_DN1994_c0_g1_i1.p1  ORF type:complete len:302 (+),score=39.40 TRINITY_DN1994_c0_g1_i1:64-969(+)
MINTRILYSRSLAYSGAFTTNTTSSYIFPRRSFFIKPFLFSRVVITRAYSQGHDTSGLTKLAYNYLMGANGVKTDLQKAQRLYEQACSLGDTHAQYSLGILYFTGSNGFQQDTAKAIELFTQSASQGNPLAQYNLGHCYENGNGVQTDKKKAAEMYTQAASNGVYEAKVQLGILHSNGEGVAQDVNKAEDLWKQAVINKSTRSPALFNLGCLKWKQKDIKKAVELLTEAGNMGNARAFYFLGNRYEDGDGIEKDEGKSKQYFEKAAKLGHEEAILRLMFGKTPLLVKKDVMARLVEMYKNK